MAIDLTQGAVFYPAFQAAFGMEQYWFGSQANDIEVSRKAAKIKGDTFGSRFTNSVTGMMEGSVKIKGVSALEKGAINWQLDQWMGRKSAINAWVAPQGVLAPLLPVLLLPTAIMDNSLTMKLADADDFSVELDARGALDSGTMLLTPQILLTGSGTGTTDLNVGFGGASSNGAVGQLHVLAIDGGTSPTVTVTIQHSSDNITFTPLISFTSMGVPAVGAAGSLRIKLPSTTTVNAYVQATWTTTGAPTAVQVMCGFARGVNLNV